MFKHTTRTILLTLLAGAFIATVYSHDTNEQWKCNHDQIKHEEPTLEEMDEANFGDAQEGRVLASYSQMRMYGYYGLLSSSSSSYQSYIKNDLIPPLLSYFEAALKVKYPVSGTFKISSSSICSVSTPSVLKSGVTADFVYMVETDYDTSSNWVASTSTCSLATGSKRPLIGKTAINTNLLKVATNNPLLHEKNMICIMHELTHALGFSSSLFKHYLDSNGKTLSGHIVSSTLDGAACQVINVSPLTSKLRSHFGCSTLKGAYMENSGSDATAGSHFERRQFSFEAMTSGLVYEMQFSKFTLAMLEGSGWYVPDYTYADPFFWGEGQGCNFLTQSCSSSSFSFEEFCTGSSRGCANPGRGGGSCSSDTRSDGCKFIHPNVNYDCDNDDGADYARLPSAETYGRGKASKCFTGTLSSTSSSASTTSYCFKYSCSGSGSSTKLTVTVGTKTATCSQAGSLAVSGYKGHITCPDPLTFCSTVGQKICPRGCMGRGSCVSGVCKCNSGYTGVDCALNA